MTRMKKEANTGWFFSAEGCVCRVLQGDKTAMCFHTSRTRRQRRRRAKGKSKARHVAPELPGMISYRAPNNHVLPLFPVFVMHASWWVVGREPQLQPLETAPNTGLQLSSYNTNTRIIHCHERHLILASGGNSS